MDNIDKLLKYVTDNTDKIISEIDHPIACTDQDLDYHMNKMTITEEQFEQALMELIADGEVELIEEDGIVKYKLTDK
jgi:hypothetical protein